MNKQNGPLGHFQPSSVSDSKPSRIRVVHVVYSFATGGMEKGICTTIKTGSGDFEHIILCLTSSGEMANQLPEGTPVISMGKKPGNSGRFILKLSKTLKQLKPDVIHTRNWSGVDGILAARLAGIGSVVHGEHGWGMDDPYGRKKKRRIIRRIADFGVREYTCVSRQMEGWLQNYIEVRKPITQIYNGIDTEKFRPPEPGEKKMLRQKLSLPEDVPIIGIVARLDPIKNHKCLLDAFAKVSTRRKDIQLLIVGDGPERAKMEAMAEGRVTFLGNRADTHLIYRVLDCFVLPSNNEGISNTILEAMASGIPVIASNVGGTPELVKDSQDGMLFEVGNAGDLSGKMQRCLDQPERMQAYVSNALKKVQTHYSNTNMVRSYEGIWRNVSPAVIMS